MSPRSIRRKVPAEAAESADPGGPVEPMTSTPSVEPVPSVGAGGPVESAEPIEPAQSAESAMAPGALRPSVRFQISRFKKGEIKPHFDDFDLEAEPGETLLGALMRIRRQLEPSLVVRHSCMHASCGTCGVRANGREVLACDTKVTDLRAKKRIKVEPLANQRLVADLATDMVDFNARFEAAGMPLVRASEVGAEVAPPDGIRAFVRFENCIECGLCLSACPIARTNRSYIGPAALAAAARVVDEPRGRELGPVLALAAEPDSVWRCHDALECTAVCPAAVDPATAILSLRRHIAASRVKGIFRRGGAVSPSKLA